MDQHLRQEVATLRQSQGAAHQEAAEATGKLGVLTNHLKEKEEFYSQYVFSVHCLFRAISKGFFVSFDALREDLLQI